MTKTTTMAVAKVDALTVLAINPERVAWLEENDPQSLLQASCALGLTRTYVEGCPCGACERASVAEERAYARKQAERLGRTVRYAVQHGRGWDWSREAYLGAIRADARMAFSYAAKVLGWTVK